MRLKKMTGRVAVCTGLAFLLSYFCTVAGGLNETAEFPLSILRAYAESRGETISPPITFGKIVDRVVDRTVAVAVGKNDRSSSGAEAMVERQIFVNEPESLELDTVCTDLTLKVVDGESVSMTYVSHIPFSSFSAEKDLETTASGKRIKIRTDQTKKEYGSTNCRGRNELTVRIPETVQNVSLKTVSGEMNLGNLAVKDAKIETVSGDIFLDDASVTHLDFNTVSGDLTFSGSFPTVEGNSVSGDINLKIKESSPKLDLDTVSGNLDLSLRSDLDAEFQYTTVSGNLDLGDIFGKMSVSGRKVQLSRGSGKGLVRISSISGDVSLSKW